MNHDAWTYSHFGTVEVPSLGHNSVSEFIDSASWACIFEVRGISPRAEFFARGLKSVLPQLIRFNRLADDCESRHFGILNSNDETPDVDIVSVCGNVSEDVKLTAFQAGLDAIVNEENGLPLRIKLYKGGKLVAVNDDRLIWHDGIETDMWANLMGWMGSHGVRPVLKAETVRPSLQL